MSTAPRRIRVLVVDDEPLARQRLRALLEDIGTSTVVAEAGTGQDAIAAVAQERPDVVLLDIRMPGMDGLEAARHLAALPAAPAVVFTTAYGDHALAAFQANAVAYLLKPVRQDQLAQALERAAALSGTRLEALAAAGHGDGGRTHVSAVIGGNLRLVPVAEVRCFLAEQKYVTVIWPGGDVPIEDPLKALEDEFAGRFLRIHRNALIAVAHVDGLVRSPDGGWRVALRGIDRQFPVSRRLLAGVRKWLRG